VRSWKPVVNQLTEPRMEIRLANVDDLDAIA
jgi:hypothetical protein